VSRRDRPQPGDPCWTHPDVRGATDPVAVKALLDAIASKEQAELDRIKRGEKP
jgi:hypothetical protein